MTDPAPAVPRGSPVTTARSSTLGLVVAVTVVLAAGCASSHGDATPTTPSTLRPLATSVFQGAGCISGGALPDSRCTPGAVDPHVTQSNLDGTICVPGYTRTVRPPVAVTNAIKRERMRAYGLTGPRSLYELDHLVPLELGGAPSSVANLWPEPWGGPHGAHVKDAEENALRRAVCNGSITLVAAQARIVSEWSR